MAFNVDLKKEKKAEQQDYKILRKKYKGKLPPFGVISRVGQETAFKEHAQLRTKGTLISYKGNVGVVKSSNKKGVLIQPIDDNFLESKAKPFFVKYEDYIPNVVYHPFNRLAVFESMVV